MEEFQLLEQALQKYIDTVFGHLPRLENVRGQFRAVRPVYGDEVFKNVGDLDFIKLMDDFDNPIVRPRVEPYKGLLRLLVPFLPVLEEAKLSADFCCGEMLILRFLHDMGLLSGELIGFEPSRSEMDGCRGLPVFHLWPAKVPLKDGAANLVLCYDALNLARGWRGIATEMARVTGPGGIVVAGFSHLGRSGLDARKLADFLLKHDVEPLVVMNHEEFEGIRNMYAGVKVS